MDSKICILLLDLMAILSGTVLPFKVQTLPSLEQKLAEVPLDDICHRVRIYCIFPVSN